MHCFGGEGWGDGQRAGGVGAACESDQTSTPVGMYWLSPPVGLRLNASKLNWLSKVEEATQILKN
jgi:hypothetical protein